MRMRVFWRVVDRVSQGTTCVLSVVAVIAIVKAGAIDVVFNPREDNLRPVLLDFSETESSVWVFVENTGTRDAVFRQAVLQIPESQVAERGRPRADLVLRQGHDAIVSAKSSRVLVLDAPARAIPRKPVARERADLFTVRIEFLGTAGVTREFYLPFRGELEGPIN